MKKTIYEEVLETLNQNKEVELYRFRYLTSGVLDFYTDKVYTAEDGEKITRSTVLASIFGVKYRLDKVKYIGTAFVRGQSFIVRDNLIYDFLSFDDINEYSFSITEAMMKERVETHLYFLGKDGSLYAFANEEKNKKTIELLLSKGLISKWEDFKEVENE